MNANPDAVDRRAALKARSRQAILDAAAELMDRHRSADFTVDDLAAAADVSRRTVFNHFASLDDVVTEVAGQMLVEIVDRMEAMATSEARETGTVLEDLAATASGDHLVPTVAYLVEVLGGGDDPRRSAREGVLMQRAFSLFTEQMSSAVASRHPEVDPLKVDLLVASFGGGALRFVNRWLAETGGIDTPESRRAWDDLVSSLTAVLREPGT